MVFLGRIASRFCPLLRRPASEPCRAVQPGGLGLILLVCWFAGEQAGESKLTAARTGLRPGRVALETAGAVPLLGKALLSAPRGASGLICRTRAKARTPDRGAREALVLQGRPFQWTRTSMAILWINRLSGGGATQAHTVHAGQRKKATEVLRWKAATASRELLSTQLW